MTFASHTQVELSDEPQFLVEITVTERRYQSLRDCSRDIIDMKGEPGAKKNWSAVSSLGTSVSPPVEVVKSTSGRQ